MATPAAGAGLEAKHYILAAFTAGFVAVAVVTIVFVVLSPAHISFSVTNAGSDNISRNGGAQLNLTIAANNTSHRAAVLYQIIFVKLLNYTGHSWRWGNVSANLPLEQPRRNVTEIHASLRLVEEGTLADLTGNKTSHGLRLSVTAVVRFKIGVAWTKLYVIRHVCVPPVDFFANKSSTADCHGA